MTDFLYARPSFWSGMARVLDIGGTMQVYNLSRSPEVADARAIASDWKVVGADMRSAIHIVEKRHASEVKSGSKRK